MKALILAVAVSAMVAGAPASAQPDHDRADRHDAQAGQYDGRDHRGHDDGEQRGRGHEGRHDNGEHRGWGRDHNGGHDWKRGERMGYDEWRGAERVDYRYHHLRRPPRGYEWRQANGDYILAAVATGLIAAIILDSGR